MKKQSHNEFCILNPTLCISSGSRGFSLIELVVVMLVVSIMVVLAIEKFTSVPALSVHLAADELGSHLRYVRNLALDRERTTRVEFSIVSNSYVVSISNTNGVYGAAKDPVRQTDWIVSVSDRFPGVKLAAVNIGGGTKLYFNGTNGVPCYNTNSPLTANGIIVFTPGLTVTVVRGTGYIRLE